MKEVLVVEDDAHVRTVVAEVLEDIGLGVVQASIAEDALALIARRRPDLIVLDLGMPPACMTGTEFLARLRETPAWAAIPVVIVSGLADVLNPDLLDGLRVHASLNKPVSAADLIRVVTEVVGRP